MASALICGLDLTLCPTPCFRTACSVSHWNGYKSNPLGRFVPMLTSARHYTCTRCRCQVFICRHCDRGNSYCAGECSERARQDSVRRASARYRLTFKGRLSNAARQQRYRDRQQQNVTHQGSLPFPTLALLLLVLNAGESGPPIQCDRAKTRIDCHFCHRQCDRFLRNRFLRPSERNVPPGRQPATAREG